MNPTWKSTTTGILALLTVHAAMAAGAAIPAGKCAAAKLKAAGKEAAAELGCHRKAVAKGEPVDQACLDKAEAKLAGSFDKADAKGGCAIEGDAPSIEDRVEEFVAAAVAALPAGGAERGPKCAGAKLKATGKKAAAKLKCYGKPLPKGGDFDPACLAKAEEKFTTAFAKAEAKAKSDCAAEGDAGTIEGLVDALVDDLRQLLVPPPTTTTIPSTTTTTLGGPAVCGNGVREGGEACDDGDDLNTNACTNACQNARCGDGFAWQDVEECDDGNTTDNDICRNNCHWAPAVCGDNMRQFGETCDDGNTADGDVCPSDCRIETCNPSGTRVQASVSYAKSTSVVVGGLVLRVRYPDGTVGIPGLGNASSVRGRISNIPTGYTHVANDLDYALRDTLAPQTQPPPALAPGLVFTVSFDLCFGASTPGAGAFSCIVEGASTTGGQDINLGANPMTCSVTVP